ncbi:hypothetical protein U1Q18_003752 [Sarracenia purpurea var. burkii]
MAKKQRCSIGSTKIKIAEYRDQNLGSGIDWLPLDLLVPQLHLHLHQILFSAKQNLRQRRQRLHRDLRRSNNQATKPVVIAATINWTSPRDSPVNSLVGKQHVQFRAVKRFGERIDPMALMWLLFRTSSVDVVGMVVVMVVIERWIWAVED